MVHDVGPQLVEAVETGDQAAVERALADRQGRSTCRCWTRDPARCAAAGVPEQVRFATKIALARRMLTRAADAGVPAGSASPRSAQRR